MFGYLVRRLLYGVFVLLGVSLLVFSLVFLSGDPTSTLLPLETSAEEREAFRRQAGLDRPIPVQYVDFLGRAIQGDFGISLRHGQPAMELVLERLPATLELALVALVVSLAISLPLGTFAALHKGRAIDHVARAVALAGQVVPNFWLGILLILLFGVTLRWLPVSGREGWQSLIMPGLVLGMVPAPALTRLLRSSLIDVLGKEYVRTAHGKGLRPGTVLRRHALRNAAIPVVTVLALQVGNLLGGAVIVEVVFAYPGMGRLAVQAITNRDITVVQSFVLLSGTLIVLTNAVLDALYSVLDPRIRLG